MNTTGGGSVSSVEMQKGAISSVEMQKGGLFTLSLGLSMLQVKPLIVNINVKNTLNFERLNENN